MPFQTVVDPAFTHAKNSQEPVAAAMTDDQRWHGLLVTEMGDIRLGGHIAAAVISARSS
jgi:hypothetical protein